MRVYLSLSPNQGPVPFNHLPMMAGAIHKWIGPNEVHDAVSLYSFSWLDGGRRVSNGLAFDRGAAFFFSAHDRGLVQRLVSGVLQDAELAFGMRVTDVSLRESPEFGARQIFRVGGPVLAKRMVEDGPDDHLAHTDAESGDVLTRALHTKLAAAGMDAAGARVSFDAEYPRPKTKLVHYKGIGNKASLCPVVVEGTPEQVAFAWEVGVGHSTGIGFGALI